MRVAVLASGRGSNLRALAAKCTAGLVDARVGLLVCDRPGAPCIQIAAEAGVPSTVTLEPMPGEDARAYDGRLGDVLEAERPDLVVLAGFMRILGPKLVSQMPCPIINIHPSLLPSFRGAHGVRDAREAGVALAGCTTHIVTEELDAGPILLQAARAIGQTAPLAAWRQAVLQLEHWLLPRTVQLFAEGRGLDDMAAGEATSWRGRSDLPAGALWSDGF